MMWIDKITLCNNSKSNVLSVAIFVINYGIFHNMNKEYNKENCFGIKCMEYDSRFFLKIKIFHRLINLIKCIIYL